MQKISVFHSYDLGLTTYDFIDNSM